MDSQISKLKGVIEAATSESMSEPNEQLLAHACEAIKTRADLPKEAIKIIKQRLSYQHGKVIFLCLELLEMATFYCDLPFQNQIATKDFLQQINSLLLLKHLPPNLVDKLLQLLSLWNRVFSSQKDILPQFFTFFENLKMKKPDLVFPPAYESKYEKYSNKKYAQAQIVAGDNIKPIKGSDPNSKSGKIQKELDLVRDNLLLANSIIDEHDPQENVKYNGALNDIIETLKLSEKKIQGIINDYNFQDETILNFCLELNDDINKTMDRYSLLSKGRKPNAYHPSSSIKKEEPLQKLSQPIQPPKPKIQPPQQQNVFQKIDQISTQQQQQPIQQVNANPPVKAKEVNLLDDDEEEQPQKATTNQQKNQQPQAPIFDQTEKQDQEFQFQQAPVQQAPITKLPQNSISDAISSLYSNDQPPQQPQFIPQMPNYIQPQQQVTMPQYNYMPQSQPQYPGMPNNMNMQNMMRSGQPMQQMQQMPQMQQMKQMQPMPPMQSMQMGQPMGMQMPMQYSMNQPNQQNQGQMKQYGLEQINQEEKKPFDKIDDMFGISSKKKIFEENDDNSLI